MASLSTKIHPWVLRCDLCALQLADGHPGEWHLVVNTETGVVARATHQGCIAEHKRMQEEHTVAHLDVSTLTPMQAEEAVRCEDLAAIVQAYHKSINMLRVMFEFSHARPRAGPLMVSFKTGHMKSTSTRSLPVSSHIEFMVSCRVNVRLPSAEQSAHLREATLDTARAATTKVAEEPLGTDAGKVWYVPRESEQYLYIDVLMLVLPTEEALRELRRVASETTLANYNSATSQLRARATSRAIQLCTEAATRLSRALLSRHAEADVGRVAAVAHGHFQEGSVGRGGPQWYHRLVEGTWGALRHVVTQEDLRMYGVPEDANCKPTMHITPTPTTLHTAERMLSLAGCDVSLRPTEVWGTQLGSAADGMDDQ